MAILDKNESRKPAIILSAHTAGLGVIRALASMDIPIIVVSYDRRDMGANSRYVKEFIQSPNPEENEADFIGLLGNLAKRFNGCLLVPTSDETLGAVSRNKKLLSRDYVVACEEWETVRIFLDKKNCYALAERIGVPAPKTRLPKSLSDLRFFSQDIGFPCVVKPTQSHIFFKSFRKKMVIVDNQEQLIRAFQESVDYGLEVMIQEYIPGNDDNGVNYNSYFYNGMPLCEFTAHKIRNAPPIIGSPAVLLSERIPAVFKTGRKMLKAINYSGYSCMEFKKDSRDNTYKFMELNARHNLSSLLAWRCGINFPWLQYQHLMNGELLYLHDYLQGIYWIDTFRDIGFRLANLGKEDLTFLQLIQPYLKPHIFAIFDFHDLRPFIARLKDVFLSGKIGKQISPVRDPIMMKSG